MPTILLLLGWRLFFYANQGNEPTHIHCCKGDKECKFWLDSENFDLTEAYAFNLSSRDKREIKKIIFEHFEYIEQQWDEFQTRKKTVKKYHNINNLRFVEGKMLLTLDGEGKEYKLADISPKLLKASEIERNTFEISASGYGVHWPLLDEDLSIDGLLGIVHSPSQIEQSA